MNTILMIGGPKDGVRTTVTEPVKQVIAVSEAPSFEELSNPLRPVKTVLYYLHRLDIATDGNKVYVFENMSINEVLSALIRRYPVP